MLNESLERWVASFLLFQLPPARQVSPNHSGLKQQVLVLLHGFCKPGIQKQPGWAVLVQVSPVARVEVISLEGQFILTGIGKTCTAKGWNSWAPWVYILSQHGLCTKSFQQGGFRAAGLLTWWSRHQHRCPETESKPGEGHITFHDLSLGVVLSLLSHSVAWSSHGVQPELKGRGYRLHLLMANGKVLEDHERLKTLHWVMPTSQPSFSTITMVIDSHVQRKAIKLLEVSIEYLHDFRIGNCDMIRNTYWFLRLVPDTKLLNPL